MNRPSYIQHSELNAIIEKAIKTLREKKDANDKKSKKEKVECSMEGIFKNASDSERSSSSKYFTQDFQRKLDLSLKDHPKVQFSEKTGKFFFKKKYPMFYTI
jgi:hypothetical protein